MPAAPHLGQENRVPGRAALAWSDIPQLGQANRTSAEFRVGMCSVINGSSASDVDLHRAKAHQRPIPSDYETPAPNTIPPRAYPLQGGIGIPVRRPGCKNVPPSHTLPCGNSVGGGLLSMRGWASRAGTRRGSDLATRGKSRALRPDQGHPPRRFRQVASCRSPLGIGNPRTDSAYISRGFASGPAASLLRLLTGLLQDTAFAARERFDPLAVDLIEDFVRAAA